MKHRKEWGEEKPNSSTKHSASFCWKMPLCSYNRWKNPLLPSQCGGKARHSQHITVRWKSPPLSTYHSEAEKPVALNISQWDGKARFSHISQWGGKAHHSQHITVRWKSPPLSTYHSKVEKPATLNIWQWGGKAAPLNIWQWGGKARCSHISQ